MLGRAFGTLAAISVGANAFLLPPGVNSIHSDGVSTFTNPTTQSVKLPCPDCVFPKFDEGVSEADQGDDLFWIQGRDRAVVLNFTVADNMKAVNVNGWQVFPVTMDNPQEPSVSEVSATASFADIQEHPERATTLEVSAAAFFVDEELVSPAGDKIINVNYQILSLQGQPISVDGAQAKLLQGADGSLMIISVEGVSKDHGVLESGPQGPPPPPPAKECSMLPAALCKWKSIVESKIGDFKQGVPHKSGGKGGCGGRKAPHKLPGHIRPHFEHFEQPDDEESPKKHHGRPPYPHPPHGMHRGPHPHGPHRHHHHFLHRFVRAFVSILVPVIAGITMGMFVSLVGMATGRLIGFLWIKFRRGGQRGYASVAQTDSETESMEKGAVETFTEEEPLPVYEAAPAYEEKGQE